MSESATTLTQPTPAEGAMRVTCVVTAYNYGHYVAGAIESILAQDYPSELVEVVVVDDGSTDDTPEAVAPYLDRVRYLRKDNGGLNSAYERGLREATGEAIAFLDADDEWPRDKLARQVELLRRRPEVGLVYGDLEVIDTAGAHLHPSYLRLHRIRPRRGAILGTLIHDNVVTGGSAMVRASLRRRILPIPAWAAFPDWWVAICAAEVSDIDYVPRSVYRYRLHGSNMGFGVDPAVRLVGPVRERELPFRRELLVRITPGAVPVPELLLALARFRSDWNAVARALGEDLHSLVPVEPERRTRAAEAFEQACDLLRGGFLDAALARCVAALADDPWHAQAAGLLDSLVAAARHEPQPVTVELDARPFAVGVRGAELLARPELFHAFASEFDADDPVSLVVQARDEELTALSDTLGDAAAPYGDALPDVVLVSTPASPGAEAGLATHLRATLGAEPRRGASRVLPQLDAERVAGLRVIAERTSRPRVLVVLATIPLADGPEAQAALNACAALERIGNDPLLAATLDPDRCELTRGGFELVELGRGREPDELRLILAEGGLAALVALGAPGSWPLRALLEGPLAGSFAVPARLLGPEAPEAAMAEALLAAAPTGWQVALAGASSLGAPTP